MRHAGAEERTLTKIEELIERARSERFKDNVAARASASEARRHARAARDARLEAEATYLLATIAHDQGSPDDALRLALEALALANQIGVTTIEAQAQLLVGIVYYQAGDMVRATESMLEALNLHRSDGDVIYEANILNGLAAAAHSMEQRDRALELYQEALAVAEPLGNYEAAVLITANMARLFWELENPEEAVIRCRRAAALAEEHAPDLLASLIAELGLYLTEAGDHEAGRQAAHQAAELLSEAHDSKFFASQLTRSRVEFASLRAAIVRGEYAQAVQHGEASARYAANAGSAEMRAEAHDLCAAAYKHLGDFEAALRHREAHQRFRSQIFNAESDLRLRTLQVAHDTLHAQEQAELYRGKAAELEQLVHHDSSSPDLEAKIIAPLEQLAAESERRFAASGRHPRAVSEMAAAVAERLGQKQVWVSQLRSAAKLHDIGKVALPDRVVAEYQTPGSAGAVELAEHTLIGAKILSAADTPILTMAATIARSHHERWDGRGLPDGLQGATIPLEARIVSVVDCYDEMVSDRTYRPAVSEKDAVRFLMQSRGTMFDASIVDTFVDVLVEVAPHLAGDQT